MNRSARIILGTLFCIVASACWGQLVEEAKRQPGARVLTGGLVFRSVTDGTGASPTEGNTVLIDYSATSPKLGAFDDTARRGAPLQIGVARSLKCWKIGLPEMHVGGTAILTCPPELAYGPAGAGTIPPNEPIQFTITLRAITK